MDVSVFFLFSLSYYYQSVFMEGVQVNDCHSVFYCAANMGDKTLRQIQRFDLPSRKVSLQTHLSVAGHIHQN